MGSFFSGPKLLPPLPPVAPPARSDSSVQDAAEADRRRRRALLGRASTNLTGDEGVTEAGIVSKPTLLGGATQPTGS